MDGPRPGFSIGRPRTGGRVRKSFTLAKSLAEKTGIDPLEIMMRWLAEGVYETVEVGPRGGQTRTKRAVPVEMLLDLAKTLAQYLHPRLSSIAVTGHDGGAIETSSVSAHILMTPELSEAMQKIAFAAAEAEAQPRVIDAGYKAE